MTATQVDYSIYAEDHAIYRHNDTTAPYVAVGGLYKYLQSNTCLAGCPGSSGGNSNEEEEEDWSGGGIGVHLWVGPFKHYVCIGNGLVWRIPRDG